MRAEWAPYTNIKSTTVALFSAGAFSKSLVLLLQLRDATREDAANAGFTKATRRTLMQLLKADMVFAGFGLVLTLALLALSGVKRAEASRSKSSTSQGSNPARPKGQQSQGSGAKGEGLTMDRVYKKLELTDEHELGALCKWLNSLSMFCACASAVTTTAVASFHMQPRLLPASTAAPSPAG
jgi:hypothetical protein